MTGHYGDGVTTSPADASDRPSDPTVDRADIEAAAARLAGPIRETPLLLLDGDEFGLDGPLSLKLELLQHSGTFKARGAMNFMLTNPIAAAGVTAASGGNHGAAVAWAAQQLGHRATIFVPTISAAAKVDRLRGYGAEVIQVGEVYAEALDACDEHRDRTGATAIHAYEAPDVFAGAGSTGLELERQVERAGRPPLDSILVACGGGGLVGGIATWFEGRSSIVACETAGTRAYAAAVEAGQPVTVPIGGVAADALGASKIGSLAFAALTKAEARSVVVDDDHVVQARTLLWQRYRLVVEASAAVPIAAIIAGAWKPEGSGTGHTGVVVCGANTALDNLD